MKHFVRTLAVFVVALLLTVVNVQTTGVTVHADSSTPDNATVLNWDTWKNGSLSSSSDTDWYQVTTSKDGFLTLQVKADFSAAVSLLNTTQSKTYDYSLYPTGNGANDTDTKLEKYALKAGTYLIKVASGYNAGNYSLEASFEPANNNDGDGNYDFSSAKELKTGDTVNGFLSQDNYTDFYKVTTPSDGFLTVNWTSEFSTPELTVYGSDHTKSYEDQYLSGNGSTDPDSRSDKLALDAGTYFIRVKSDSSEETGRYTLKTTFDAADNNDGHGNRSFSSASEISYGQTVKGFLSEDNFNDFYKFTVPKKERVVLNFSSEISDLEMTVYNADQSKELVDAYAFGKGASNPDNQNENVELDAGTYYVRMKSDSTGRYTLKVSRAASEDQTVTMYRAYNPNSGEHFYTSSTKEFNHIVSLGWKDEGVGWIAPEKSKTPVFRLYNANGGEHHYTTSTKEKNALIKAGWKDEGIGWYSDDAETVPLYRQYNPNAFANNHNYTTQTHERDVLISLGWRDEGIGWYGVSAK